MSVKPPDTVLDRPLVSFGPEICGDLPSALRREWLVTNGLGGYASGTVAGVNTRRYHGMLVAALTPPVVRTVLVGGLIDWGVYDGRRYPLATHEFGDGTVDPRGYRHLQAFALDGMLPVWTFALGDALLQKRVWMAHGANTTYVMYRLLRATRTVELEITPLVTYRDFHTLTSGRGWRPAVTADPRGVEIRAFEGAAPVRLVAETGRFAAHGEWYWNFLHREESARGLDDRSDLFAPGVFTASLSPGEHLALVATSEAAPPAADSRPLAAAQARQVQLLQRAGARDSHPVVQQLVLAADQFIVRRTIAAPGTASDVGQTVIAGYPWFNDWGRDAMIALPGLTLATGRPEVAAEILRTFARYVADGLIPNNFPERAGADPGYNTADASLWYVLAVRATHEATRDGRLVDEVLPSLREVIDRYERGTRHGIGMDPADGLLRQGAPGLALTWMDAKIGGGVVTPRAGKAVEINALWYNALRALAVLLAARDGPAAQRYTAAADRVRAAFRARFVRPGRRSLVDVVDGPEGDDLAVRPNQIFAVSLPFPLLERDEAAAVVDEVGRALLTTYGLRSLSPDDPAYHGEYGGDPIHRDRAYHQGPAWAWLAGAYAEAYHRVYWDLEGARSLLRPFEHHLRDAGLGTISEIFEGDPPHRPRGAIAQAWSVGEVLRVWRALERA
ncbi:MAG: glycogen debranching protein [Bacillati bacterium ANGP1]|uniref:Glycogen debranching protein n=1 Tax=Candidatus Segetimicrobium genomatis TaxID=2569760 RepID=A0A537M684_9BACT|nr:MAG: glycogen debranching protein [Terrabacteria group bacterium ANGP1]